MTTTKLATPIKNDQTYYGEISLAIQAKTKQSLEELKNNFSKEGLKVKLVLESHFDEKEISSEVLEIWDVEWEEWEEF